MTLPSERYNAIRNARNFLCDLMDPSKTPRVPAAIRKRARDRLKHFPTEYDVSEWEREEARRAARQAWYVNRSRAELPKTAKP